MNPNIVPACITPESGEVWSTDSRGDTVVTGLLPLAGSGPPADELAATAPFYLDVLNSCLYFANSDRTGWSGLIGAGQPPE